MNYSLTRVSSNRKTGPIPVSTTSAVTCPTSCPLRNNGCYMDGGPGAIHWRAITKGDRGVAFDKFCEQVAALPKGQLWRHNQAGDLPGDGNDMDHAKVSQLVVANRGRRGFTYTHKPMDTDANRKAVREANQQGFTINLSANSLVHADALADLNVGPVASVVSIKWQRQHDKKGAWTELWVTIVPVSKAWLHLQVVRLRCVLLPIRMICLAIGVSFVLSLIVVQLLYFLHMVCVRLRLLQLQNKTTEFRSFNWRLTWNGNTIAFMPTMKFPLLVAGIALCWHE
jgi:hypothetical protein